MWKYYKRWFIDSDDPEYGKAFALYRIEGFRVELYEGLERWSKSPFAGKVLLDISGAGGSWDNIKEISSEEAEEIKRQLFDKDGNRIAPV